MRIHVSGRCSAKEVAHGRASITSSRDYVIMMSARTRAIRRARTRIKSNVAVVGPMNVPMKSKEALNHRIGGAAEIKRADMIRAEIGKIGRWRGEVRQRSALPGVEGSAGTPVRERNLS